MTSVHRATTTVSVRTDATYDAVLPLTWAQANMWDAVWGYREEAVDLVLGLPLLLEAAVPQPDALAALSRLLSRHETARTTFDRSQRRQRVHARAELTVVLADADADPQQALDAVLAELSSTPFDPEREPPVRAGLVRTGAGVRAVALALSHLAFDAYGARLLLDDLSAELTGHAGATSAQSGELVARESSRPLTDRSDATIARWLAALRPLPPGCGIVPTRRSRFTGYHLGSTALPVAAQAAAVRTGTSGGSVVLAAFVAALQEVVPQPPAALQLIAGNRYYPDLSGYAGLALQNGLFVMPPHTPVFDDLTGRTHHAALWAYTNARYDTRRLREAVFDLHARGEAADLSWFFNDARKGPADWAGLERQIDSLDTLLSQEDPRPVPVLERELLDATAFLHLLPAGRKCSLLLVVDDAVIDRHAAERLLAQARSSVIAAARAAGTG